MPEQFSAIPTMYASVRFRSRLEARWAAFFDLVAWPWSYEPVDLAGYIPDFVVGWNGAHPLLVECKPVVTHVADALAKVRRSGWTHDRVVVLSDLFVDEDLKELAAGYTGDWSVSGTDTQVAAFRHCESCKGLTVADEDRWVRHSRRCLRCGEEQTSALLPGAPGVVQLWRKAGNEVQWHAHGLANSRLRS